MGFLKKLQRALRVRAADQPLPSGSMMVNLDGTIGATTVPATYPRRLLQEVGNGVLSLFREARAAQLPLTEVSLYFGSLHVTARELRTGVLIYFAPQTGENPHPAQTP